MAKQKKEEQNSKEKYIKSAFLSRTVLKDIHEVLTHYNIEQKIELTEHFIKMFKELRGFERPKDLSAFQEFTNREVELLKKYRNAYKPYEAKQFTALFDFNNVLLDKGYFTKEEFNNLTKEKRKLSEQDLIAFCSFMDNVLLDKLHSIYLQEDVDPDNLASIPQKEENDMDMTEARRLLALHYFFKATLGLDYRKRTDLSNYARFAHLLLGKKIIKLQDSNIYKKYKKLPNYNKGRQLIQDLNYIKPFFHELDLQKAVEMIEKEIETETKELNK